MGRPLALALLPFLAATSAACGDVRIYPLRHNAPDAGGGTGGVDAPDPPIPCLGTSMVGYATVPGDTASTTGGGRGDPMIARTPEDLAMYAALEEPLVIQVRGTLELPASIRFVSNKTVYGDPNTPGSGVTGAGLNFTDASNIIVRNLQISKATLDEGDAITLLRSQHVWIDHCDLSSEVSGGNYDGLIDITHASDFITVSWTVFHDHRDTSLIGHSEDNMLEDTGHFRVTFHHNLFARVFSGPRLRFGTAHVYNNQFEDIAEAGSFGVASESYGAMIVVANYFKNVAQPITTMFMDEFGGSAWEERNRFVESGALNIGAPMLAKPVPNYDSTPDTAESVPTVVPICAGIGKLVDPLAY